MLLGGKEIINIFVFEVWDFYLLYNDNVFSIEFFICELNNFECIMYLYIINNIFWVKFFKGVN